MWDLIPRQPIRGDLGLGLHVGWWEEISIIIYSNTRMRRGRNNL
jgi:hypothetical protein